MARNEKKEYWGADLPKNHPALVELDAFCNDDQGMITRSDATRMILIAWAKARQGKDTAIWPGSTVQQSAQPVQQNAAQESPRSVRRPLNGNAAAVELD